MKTSVIDYVLSGLAICLLLAVSAGLVWSFLPISKQIFLDYHVLVDFGLLLLLYGLFSALLVRTLLRIRPIDPGAHSMDSNTFTHWKLITVVYRLGQSALLPMTPVFLKPVIETLFGARIGRDVALGGVIDDPYMVCIGDGAVLGNASLISGNFISGGLLTCGKVLIGAGATIGANSVIFPGVEIGDNATLVGGSYVISGTKVPAGETWRGNPARKWLQQAVTQTPAGD